MPSREGVWEGSYPLPRKVLTFFTQKMLKFFTLAVSCLTVLTAFMSKRLMFPCKLQLFIHHNRQKEQGTLVLKLFFFLSSLRRFPLNLFFQTTRATAPVNPQSYLPAIRAQDLVYNVNNEHKFFTQQTHRGEHRQMLPIICGENYG